MAEVKMNYKSNSHASREEDAQERDIPEKQRLEKVGTGRSRRMRKSLARRFVDIFFADDVGDVKEYLIRDIVVPAVQDAIVDGVMGALSMIFYGDSRRTSKRNSKSGGTKINYSGAFTGGSQKKDRPSASSRKSGKGFESLMKDNRGDAEEIKSVLEEMLDQYGTVSVVDYYDAFGETSEFTDNHYGWTDLSDIRVKRVPRGFYDEDEKRWVDGYMVEMPRPSELD